MHVRARHATYVIISTRENTYVCDWRLPRRFSGWVTSRGGNTRTRRRVYPEGGVGVQGRGRIRGGARWGEERGGTGWGRGDGRPRAINIPKYAGNSRAAHAYVYACARARSRSRTSSELCQYMLSTYANCKYNLSGPVYIRDCAGICARTNCKCNITLASAHMLHIRDIWRVHFPILGSP